LPISSRDDGSCAYRRASALSTLASMLCRLATGSLPPGAVVVVEQPVMAPIPRAAADAMARSLVFMMRIPLRGCVGIRSTQNGR